MSTENYQTFSGRTEQGMATLIVVVILLALLTITVLIVSRSTVTELKVSSNQNREKEAFAAAQAGLDRGSQVFLASSGLSSFTCGSSVALGSEGAEYCYSASVTASGAATITGLGRSADGTGTASVVEVFTLSNAPGFGDLVPFVASGNIPTGGGFTLVPNPNSGGEGVPVAAWSLSAGTSGTASWDVCEYDEYINGLCSGGASQGDYMCKKDDEDGCEAFVQDTDVPDPFALLFDDDVSGCNGTPSNDACPVETIRESYTKLELFDCPNPQQGPQPTSGRTMDEAVALAKENGYMGLPVIWIEGDCDIKNDLGSSDSPVIVVIEGDVALQGGNTYGIVFAMTDNYTQNPADLNELKYNGSAIINGAVLTNSEITQTNGDGTIAYSPDVLSGLTEAGEEGIGLVRARGSWRDF